MRKIEINKKKVGAKISQIRSDNKLSEREFAEQLGVASVCRIKKWENGEALPSVENLISICNNFDIRFDELVDFYNRV